MQDPDRRGRRARCAALIQGCRVHEWSWNAPSLFSKHQRAVAPRRSRVASSPEGRSVGAPCERSGRSSKLHLLLAFVGQLGAPAYRSSQPSAPCSTDQHQDERSNYDPDQRALCSGGGDRGVSLMVLPEASWLRCSNLKCRNEGQGPKGAEDAYEPLLHHRPPCCARATRSRLIRSNTSLCS
jgi:hypothetical protein